MTRRAIPFLLPGIIWTLLFTILPLLYTVYLSLTDYQILRAPTFVGLSNYQNLLTSSVFSAVLPTTLLYAFGGALISLVIGIFAAWVFSHDSLPLIHRLRTVFASPLLIAPVAAGAIGALLLNPNIGIRGSTLLLNPSVAPLSILLVDSWRWIPLICFSVLLIIHQMPPNESSDAGGFRALLPRLLTPLAILALLRALEGLKLIDVIAVMTDGGPGGSTENLSHFAYRVAFEQLNVGSAAAIIVMLMFMALPLIVAIGWLSRRWLLQMERG